MRFKLLAGSHAEKQKDGTQRLYRAGEVVDSKVDLTARFGETKFQRLGDSRKGLPTGPVQAASVAPGGQVSSGHQACTSLEDGTTVSFAKDASVAAPTPAKAPKTEPIDHRIASRQEEGARIQQSRADAQEADDEDETEDQEDEEDEDETLVSSKSNVESDEDYNAMLNDMTVDELRAHAQEEEVDLTGCRTKSDILRKLKGSR